jgi:uroporphyrinogen decarboxylase
MDIYEVKKKYGDQLCLCGGIEVDLLCRGTRAEVASLSEKYMKEIGSNGGYCLGSSNSIPNYINIENYQEMLVTGRNYQNKSGV